VTLFLERRPIPGVVLCALAAAIKLPAAAALVFMAVVWAREQTGFLERAKRVLQVAGASAVVILPLSALPGIGFSWLSTSLFSTPQKVRLAITPATSIGWVLTRLLRALDMVVNERHVEAHVGTFAFGLVGIFALVLLWRVRRETMVRYLGVLLLAAAWGGPAAWPWYFIWGLALVAACSEVQYARVIPVFVVKADGTVALPINASPWVLSVYAGAVAAALFAWFRRREAGVSNLGSRGPSALVES
jgi:hypothetical protein